MRHLLSRSLAVVFATSVPTLVAAAPREVAQEYLGNAINLIEAKHINSSDADWPRIRAEADAMASDAQKPAETYPAIRHVLDQLGEKHSYLREPSQQAVATSQASAGAVKPDRQLSQWRLVDGKFGLVQLPELDTIRDGGDALGRSYSATLKAGLILLDQSNLCGWIVDLRENHGGNMWPMLQGLDPLLGTSPFGYFAVQGGQTVPWIRTNAGIFPGAGTSSDVEPVFRLRSELAPVAILIGPGTASSGEMVALAFIGRQGVQTFGLPSAGFTTANTPYPLSDGAYLVITETTVRDRTGRDYSGSIIPNLQTPLNLEESAATEWLAKQCSGRDPSD